MTDAEVLREAAEALEARSAFMHSMLSKGPDAPHGKRAWA